MAQPTEKHDDLFRKYFCLNNIAYKGHTLTILYDAEGNQYGRGKGLRVFVEDRKVAGLKKLAHLECEIDLDSLGGYQLTTGIAKGRLILKLQKFSHNLKIGFIFSGRL